MTDEEIEKEAKEYSQGNFYSKQGFLYGYERGFAESRKNVLYMYKKYLDVCREIEQLKQSKNALTIQYEQDIAELKAQIEKMKCCENCNNHKKGNCTEDKMFFTRTLKECSEWEFAE